MSREPRLSVVLPYYRNPLMLDRQITCWCYEWPAALQESVEIVIVDDASPEAAWPVIQSRFRLSCVPRLQLYRVKVDKPWHQHAARNLGAHFASAPWLLMTDMDHLLPADTLAAVLSLQDGSRSHFFARRDLDIASRVTNEWRYMPETLNRDGEPKPHINSFAITREAYWRAGGYDEDFCGVYGTDSLFRERLFKVAPRVDLTSPLIRVPREVIPDASTTSLARKEGREPRAKARIKAEKRARGEADKVKVLQFEGERII
jgi:glycosyltransferase involved in cell wall biosynthesis